MASNDRDSAFLRALRVLRGCLFRFVDQMATRLKLDWERFRANWERVQREIAEATPSGGRGPRIVVVTKYITRAETSQLLRNGITPLGENRADAVVEKTEGTDPEHWHFIGHLQRNKIARVLPRVSLLHSLDSERLAAAVNRWAAESGPRPFPCLVQVNVSGEGTKGGLRVEDVESAILGWRERFPHLSLRGLMTMAPLADPESCRPCFRTLRELLQRVRDRLSPSLAKEFSELSMGMSNDYRVATEEGATWLRLGTILYEP